MNSNEFLNKVTKFVKSCNSSSLPCKVELVRIADGDTFSVSLILSDRFIVDPHRGFTRPISFDSFFKIFEKTFPDVKEEIPFCISYASLRHRYSIEFTIHDDLLPF